MAEGLMLLGMVLLVIAAVGLLRLPDALSRQHAATKAATLDMGVSYLYVSDTRINAGSPSDPTRGLVKGEYDSSVWILGAQYSMAF